MIETSKKRLMRWLLPLILVLLMLLDGQISNVLRLVSGNYIFLNSHLLLLGLIVGCLSFSRRYMVILSLFLGLLFDTYYYSILGINMVSMPLTVLLIYVVFEYVEPSIFSILLSLVIFITIMDGSAFILQALFKLIQGDTLNFIVRNLGPTIMMNVGIYFLLSWPLKKFTRL